MEPCRLERIDVGEDGGRDERRSQPTERAGVQPTSPGEVAGQQGQDEETQVAGVELAVLVQLQSEEHRHLDGDGGRRRERERDDGVPPRSRVQLSAAGGRRDQLLPEAVRVFLGELPREGVELAHPLHRDEERLVGGEPRVAEHRHLLAQVILELRDVDRVDRLPAADEAPPLVDLLLERDGRIRSRHLQAPCGSGVARQMPRSVASTACHCLRSSARCARPCAVIP